MQEIILHEMSIFFLGYFRIQQFAILALAHPDARLPLEPLCAFNPNARTIIAANLEKIAINICKRYRLFLYAD
ncbi:hypothetical protein EHS13_06975 [Paenibacillus psychroresistens]|uniref:Uncharacterized protein n=1 Tax=Paenibacillus psychroresistens TaxID=1778678 RepID=A0A6B8RFD5_9BACL|nr:hypothetical protein EHS13_06975 [Paenibacillus psychroresistens]